MTIDPYANVQQWLSAVQFCEWRKLNNILRIKFKYIEREIIPNPNQPSNFNQMLKTPATLTRVVAVTGYQFLGYAPEVTAPTLLQDTVEVNFGRINKLIGHGETGMASFTYAQDPSTITWGGPRITLQLFCADPDFSVEIPLKLPTRTDEAQVGGNFYRWDGT